MNLDATNQQKWSDLLTQAVTQPGLILKAYSAFHGYSLGNQLGALLQCHRHGIEPGPIDTYKGWLDKGRHVRKGEKAIWLCMPLTRKKTNGDTGEDELYITAFVWKPRWLCWRRPSEPVPMPAIPDGTKNAPLLRLASKRFHSPHKRNVQGSRRNPRLLYRRLLNCLTKPLFHEVAHVFCCPRQNPTSATLTDAKELARIEAEAVALLFVNRLDWHALNTAEATFKTGEGD